MALVLVLSIFQPLFFSTANLQVLARQVPILCVLAIAETFVILGGEIDLSVANVAAFSAMAGAIVMGADFGMLVGVGVMLAIGVGFGLLNGLVTAKFKIPAFLVTLGSSGIAYGLTYIISGGISVPFYEETFMQIWGRGEILFVPGIFIWLIIIAFLGYVSIHRSVFGIHLLATGGNEVAASYSGVNTRSVKMKSLIISGVLASFAGMLLLGRLGSGRVGALTGSELDAIAASVIGGVNLFGGNGSVYAPLIGTFILVMISGGIVMLGVVLGYEWLVRGLIVIAIVAMGRRRKA